MCKKWQKNESGPNIILQKTQLELNYYYFMVIFYLYYLCFSVYNCYKKINSDHYML